jgi:hypothetical protein
VFDTASDEAASVRVGGRGTEATNSPGCIGMNDPTHDGFYRSQSQAGQFHAGDRISINGADLVPGTVDTFTVTGPEFGTRVVALGATFTYTFQDDTSPFLSVVSWSTNIPLRRAGTSAASTSQPEARSNAGRPELPKRSVLCRVARTPSSSSKRRRPIAMLPAGAPAPNRVRGALKVFAQLRQALCELRKVRPRLG